MAYTFTTSFPYLLNRVGVLMGELFSERLTKFGITLPMYRVLAVLSQEGPQRLGDLSAMVTVEISTLSRLISSMKKSGLVSRTRPENDGRTVNIDLTAKGAELISQLMPIAEQFESVSTSAFTAQEVAELKRSLDVIYDSLQSLGNKPPLSCR